MAVSKKQRRKIVRNKRVFWWCVKPDYTAFPSMNIKHDFDRSIRKHLLIAQFDNLRNSFLLDIVRVDGCLGVFSL